MSFPLTLLYLFIQAKDDAKMNICSLNFLMLYAHMTYFGLNKQAKISQVRRKEMKNF